MSEKVFVSMGTPYTDAQRQFRAVLMGVLRDQVELDPRAIDVNEYPPYDPLKYIVNVIENCAGVVVVAYERKHVQNGAEKRRSADEKAISNNTYTTPWNQIESAFAYSLGKPLFMICEKGLCKEGLIDQRLPWNVVELEMDPKSLSDESLMKRLRSWAQTLPAHRPRKTARTIDLVEVQRMPLSEILPQLTVKSWAILATLVVSMFSLGLFVGAFAK